MRFFDSAARRYHLIPRRLNAILHIEQNLLYSNSHLEMRKVHWYFVISLSSICDLKKGNNIRKGILTTFTSKLERIATLLITKYEILSQLSIKTKIVLNGRQPDSSVKKTFFLFSMNKVYKVRGLKIRFHLLKVLTNDVICEKPKAG